MKSTYIFKTAVKSLNANRSRSLLTILGIVIGILSIIVLMSIGEGAQGWILNQLKSLGSQTLFIEPGARATGPQSYDSFISDSLKERELKTILDKRLVPHIETASPLVLVPGKIEYLGTNYSASVFGAGESFFDILGYSPDIGSNITIDDVNARANVVVIGSEVKKQLFGESDALNEYVKIKNRRFRIVGILDPKGSSGTFNIDKSVILPYTTAKDYLLGKDSFNFIIAKVISEDKMPYAIRDIEITLRDMHNIDDPKNDDFNISTQADAISRISSITTVLTALLVSIAAISLLVGGIGIMNIMLVSVTERTKEIGLRKAIGATSKNILNQFLIESIILTGLGGLIGIILGTIISFFASIVFSNLLNTSWPFIFPYKATILGFVVSTGIGLIFGIFPAKQASSKSPIEALRYE